MLPVNRRYEYDHSNSNDDVDTGSRRYQNPNPKDARYCIMKRPQPTFTDEMVQEVHELVETLKMGYSTAAHIVARNHNLITETAQPNWMNNRDKGYH